MRKMKFTFVMLLLAIFIAMFAGEVLAYPNWIKITAPTKLGLVKNGKDINKGDYWAVRITVTYHNNPNSGRIVKAIFDKTFTVTELRPDVSVAYWNKAESPVKLSSSKVNQVEVWPNSTARLDYLIPLNNVIRPSNSSIDNWKGLNEWFAKHSTFFIYKSWGHDFQVRSEQL